MENSTVAALITLFNKASVIVMALFALCGPVAIFGYKS
jgi:hypothetical protein